MKAGSTGHWGWPLGAHPSPWGKKELLRVLSRGVTLPDGHFSYNSTAANESNRERLEVDQVGGDCNSPGRTRWPMRAVRGPEEIAMQTMLRG